MKNPGTRLPVIDALKAGAAQLIVLHHLAAYGPLSDAVQPAVPALIAWLYDNARMAVQVFLVIGGYLAARGLLSGRVQGTGTLAMALVNRYLRLAIPFLAALALAIAAAMTARHWMEADFIPDAPAWPQLLAHALLLHSVLDFDALTAGAWYIAIDFQLFLLLAALAWTGSRLPLLIRPLPLLLVLGMAASLFWFNRQPALDDWAPYFFGAYGMGAAVYWAHHHSWHRSWWLGLLVTLALTALLVDFRPRIAIAASAALVLFLSHGQHRFNAWASHALPQYLGKTSYALFLVHFPVLLLGNALFSATGLSGAWAGSIGMLTVWVVSMWVADGFYRRVEQPAARLRAEALLQFWRNRSVLQSLRFRLSLLLLGVLAVPV